MRLHFTSFAALVVLTIILTPLSAQIHFEGLVYQGSGEPQLDLASSVATSPDGRHVYTSSYEDNAITIFDRNVLTGNLTFSNSFREGEGGTRGLSSIYAVIVSPDGNHVYTANSGSNTIVAFSRDVATGNLTYVQTLTDNVDGVDGLQGILFLASSPDGNNIYATGPDENALAVFSRDVNTGMLEMVEVHRAGVGDLTDFSYPLSLTVSPDGKNVYAVAYDDAAVNTFTRDTETGALTYSGRMVNGTNGVSGLNGTYSVFVSPDNKNVYVAGTDDSAVAVFGRDLNTGVLSYIETQSDGTNGVDGLFGALIMEASPDGNYLYVLGAYEDAMAIFQRMSNGALTFVTKVENGVGSVDKMSYPIDLSISDDGENVYVTSFNDNALVVFERNPTTGTLFFVDAEEANSDGVNGMSGANSVTLSSNGDHLYMTGENDQAVAFFTRNEATGQLEFVESHINSSDGVTGLNGVRDIAITPDDKFVYAAGFWDHSIAIFERNNNNGTLTFSDRFRDNSSVGLNGVSSITISPDGKYLYATGFWENALTAFSIDPTSGALTLIGSQFRDGVAGIDGLTWANGSTISPDGKTVYVTSAFDNSVTAFGVNASDGTLSSLQFVKDGISGVNGLKGAEDVVVSPDNKYVYVAGEGENAIGIFSRNVNTGMLTFQGFKQNGIDGIGGIGGVSNLAFDPSGTHLYATGADENALAVFQINANNGDLIFEKSQTDNLNNVNGLGGAQGLIVSGDNRYIYVTAKTDDAIGIFSCTYIVDMEETICQGDSVVVGASTYKNSGAYLDTFAFGGCWTVIDLDLTVYPDQVEINEEICQSSSYTFNGQTYSTSGTYTAVFNSSLNCDSTVVLNLQVVDEYTGITVEQQICQGESYDFGGNSYIQSGTYSNTFTSQDGCDSTVNLQLTVANSFDQTMDVMICEGEFYIFGSKNYIASGTYTENFVAASGCDSTVTLSLTVLDPNGPNLVNASICQGEVYRIGGNDYSQEGTFQTSVTTIGGCQADVTLNLSVNDVYSMSITETICEGTSYDFGGQTLTTAGNFTRTFQTITGCDSTVNLRLNIAPSNVTLNEVICEGDTYMVGGTAYSETGNYTAVLSSTLGCGDSTVTLNLTVEPDASTQNIEVCFGGSYQLGNTNYNQSGTYTENLTGNNNCPLEVTLNLTVGEDLTATETINSDNGAGNGSINLLMNGGFAPYTYSWSNNATTKDISGLSSGTYTVTVTDKIGCEKSFSFEVSLSTGIADLDDALLLQLMPNPIRTNQQVALQIDSPEQSSLRLELFNTAGQLLFQEKIQVGSGQVRHFIDSPEQAGLYLLRVSDEEGGQRTLRLSVQ
ncbi:MAG: beta-propeller fold lactonase family protein [Bacteroidota bacterium]